ncbi:MAG: hypothetical protein ACI4IQ_01065 [Eubacterium sp.]
MKKGDKVLLIILIGIAGALIAFSGKASYGAKEGLALAENTIIPSLLPLLIIFFLIMKTGAKDVIAKCFGSISYYIFNLPQVTFPAIFFGLTGGYPTGALMTKELLDNGEIDDEEARRMLRFNFCGGCGFIITALSASVLGNVKIGAVLFISNALSCVLIGFGLSFSKKREKSGFYSFTEHKNIGDCLVEAVNSSIRSVLNLTAFIVLFSAVTSIFEIPKAVMPLIEITNGICSQNDIPLAQISAYLSFGGICIHFQILGIIKQARMKYFDFLFFRILSGLLSYCTAKAIFYFFPADTFVFSNNSVAVAQFSSVNLALSVLLIIGCFVIILDIHSKKIC